MNYNAFRIVTTTVVALVLVQAIEAQPRPRNQGPRTQGDGGGGTPAGRELPKDEKLVQLYANFVRDAEKIAQDYERQNKIDEARAVYQEIQRLVPQYRVAQQKLEEFRKQEETADRKQLDISADKGWQDTGVYAVAGKPLTIKATGTWTFSLSHNVSPDGIELPADLRSFSLGSLIGVIVDSESEQQRPFLIGSSQSLVPSQSGRLMLRMYDTDPTDNSGRLRVEIQGTFERR
jgi:hypothetical protein